MTIDREELLEEMKLRKNIRSIIQIIRKRKQINEKNNLNAEPMIETNNEERLRAAIRQLILIEKVALGDEVPHEKTGINWLRQTLKKVIPTIKSNYLAMTTDPAQRDSFIAHLINGIDNLLAPVEANIDAPLDTGLALSEQSVPVDIDEEPLEIGMEDEAPEEAEEEDEGVAMVARGIEGDHDETGRNVAGRVFKQIQDAIADDFAELGAEEDRELFQKYLKTNILFWRDKFEDELAKSLPAPTTPEYEQGLDAQQASPPEELPPEELPPEDEAPAPLEEDDEEDATVATYKNGIV